MVQIFELFATISLKSDEFNKGIEKAQSTMGKLAAGMENVVKVVGGIKLASAAFDKIAGSVGAAVERYDTLNRFPKVLQQMGYSATDASNATQKLSDGVLGLPTALNEIVSGAQKITLLTGDLERSTDTALALNNAFYASGATAADASRGFIQYTQMLSKGKADMQSWRTLQETMGYALRETGIALGIASGNSNELYEALKDGVITFDQLNAKIIELNEGVGGFAELAKINSGGIATAWTNMGTAIVRGITGIMTTINEAIQSMGGFEGVIGKLKNGFTSFLNGVNSSVKVIIPAFISSFSAIAPQAASAFKAIQRAFNDIFKAIISSNLIQNITNLLAKMAKNGLEAAGTISKIFSGAVIAVINTASAAIRFLTENFETMLGIFVPLITAFVTFKAVIAIQQTITMVAGAMNALATGASLAAVAEATLAGTSIKVGAAKTALAAIVGVLTGKITLATAQQWLLNAAQMSSPHVWLIAGIAALVAGLVYLATRTDETTKKYKEMAKAAKESTKEYEENKKAIDNTANAEIAKAETVRILKNRLYELDDQLKAGNLTEAESVKVKKDMQGTMQGINDIIPDFNLAINSETGEWNKQRGEIDALTDSFIKLASAKAMSKAYQEKVDLAAKRIVDAKDKLEEISKTPSLTAEDYVALGYGKDEIIPEDIKKVLDPTIAAKETQDKIIAQSQEDMSKYITSMTEELSKIPTETSKAADKQFKITSSGAAKETAEKKKQYEIDLQNLEHARDREEITELEFYQGLSGIRDKYFTVGSEEYENYTTEIIKFYNKMAKEAKKKAEEVRKTEYDNISKRAETVKNIGLVTLEDEVTTAEKTVGIWKAAVEKYEDDLELRLAALVKLHEAEEDLEQKTANRQQKAFDREVNKFEFLKFFGLKNKNDELEFNKELLKSDKLTAEQRQETMKKIFTLNKEIREDESEERKKADKEFEEQEKKYEDAFEARKKVIIGTSNIFDKVAAKERKSAFDMRMNMQERLDEIKAYKANIQKLTEMGLAEGMIEQFKDMGIGANAQMEALIKDGERGVERTNKLYEDIVENAEGIVKSELGEKPVKLEADTDGLKKQIAELKLDPVKVDVILNDVLSFGNAVTASLSTGTSGSAIAGIGSAVETETSVTTIDIPEAAAQIQASGQSSIDNTANMIAAALEGGLSMIADTIFAALPKELQLNLEGRQVGEIMWGDLTDIGQRRGRIFAPTTEQIASIARGAAL